MNTLKLIYIILHYLECAMRTGYSNYTRIMPDALEISQCQFNEILCILARSGFIWDVSISHNVDGTVTVGKPFAPKITLTGLEFLATNKTMKKIAKKLSK